MSNPTATELTASSWVLIDSRHLESVDFHSLSPRARVVEACFLIEAEAGHDVEMPQPDGVVVSAHFNVVRGINRAIEEIF